MSREEGLPRDLRAGAGAMPWSLRPERVPRLKDLLSWGADWVELPETGAPSDGVDPRGYRMVGLQRVFAPDGVRNLLRKTVDTKTGGLLRTDPPRVASWPEV